jgi:hypothetical protein
LKTLDGCEILVVIEVENQVRLTLLERSLEDRVAIGVADHARALERQAPFDAGLDPLLGLQDH